MNKYQTLLFELEKELKGLSHKKETAEQNLQDKNNERRRLAFLIAEAEKKQEDLKEEQKIFKNHTFALIDFLFPLIMVIVFEGVAIIPVIFWSFPVGGIAYKLLWIALWNVISLVFANGLKENWHDLKTSIAVRKKYKNKKNIEELIEKCKKRLERLKSKKNVAIRQEEELGDEIELLKSNIKGKENRISLIKTAFLNASMKLSNTNPAVEQALNVEFRSDKEKDFTEPMLRKRGRRNKSSK